MFHLIWYILIGLIAGVIAKSVMHEHLTIFWTIVLGIIGSILGGAVTQMFLRPRNERFLTRGYGHDPGTSHEPAFEIDGDQRGRLAFVAGVQQFRPATIATKEHCRR